MKIRKYSVIQSVRIFLPCMISMFFWIYTHRPDGMFIVMSTLCIWVFSTSAANEKEMLRIIFLCALMISLYTFGLSLVINFAAGTFFFVFIMTFFGMIWSPTRPIVPVSLMCASIGLSMEQGYYGGVNRGISAFVAFFVVLIFSYLLSGETRNAVSAVVENYAEGIKELLDLIRDPSKDGSFGTRIEELKQQIGEAGLEADLMVNKRQYVVRKTVIFVRQYSLLFRCFRRLTRDLVLVLESPEVKEGQGIKGEVQIAMARYLSFQIGAVLDMIKTRKRVEPATAGDEGLLKKWEKVCNEKALTAGDGQTGGILVFGLECLRKDLKVFEDSVCGIFTINERYGKLGKSQ